MEEGDLLALPPPKAELSDEESHDHSEDGENEDSTKEDEEFHPWLPHFLPCRGAEG